MKKQIADFWSKNAPYLGYDDPYISRFKDEPQVKDLLDTYFHKGEQVLEVGCGLGYDSKYLRNKGCIVYPIDLSQENALKAGGLCMDAEDLEFGVESFDKVWSYGVLHHTPNTQKAIDEIHRVLKVGGEAVIMLYHKGYAWWYLKLLGKSTNDYDHTPLSKMYSRKQIRKMFSKFRGRCCWVSAFEGNKTTYKILSKHKWLKDRFGSFIIIHAIK